MSFYLSFIFRNALQVLYKSGTCFALIFTPSIDELTSFLIDSVFFVVKEVLGGYVAFQGFPLIVWEGFKLREQTIKFYNTQINYVCLFF